MDLTSSRAQEMHCDQKGSRKSLLKWTQGLKTQSLLGSVWASKDAVEKTSVCPHLLQLILSSTVLCF